MEVTPVPLNLVQARMLGTLFTPQADGAVGRSSQAQARRERSVEDREKREERRSAAYETALTSVMTASRPSEVVLKGEQEMRPGSRSAERFQTREELTAQTNGAKRQFRQALAEAGTPPRVEPKTTAQTSSNATAATKAEPQNTGGPAMPAPDAPKAAAQSNAKTMAQVAPSVTRIPAPQAQPQVAAPSRPANLGPTANVAVSNQIRVGAVPTALGRASAQPGSERSGVVATAPASEASASRKSGVLANASSQADATEPRNSEANIERIVRLVQARIGKDRSVAHLRLDPPELGTVKLHMDLRQDQLALEVEAQTPAAQRVLEDELDTLRRNLEAAGVRVERIEVRLAPEPSTPEQAPQQQFGQQGQGGGAGQDGRFAGGEARSGMESAGSAASVPPAEPAEWRGRSEGPATESLVDVLA
jgi:flagellar hook-length control protein FliK